jgi:DNA-binding IclR family transcriptional regulator
MVELARRFGETVMLGAMLGDTLVYLDTIESDQLVRYSPPRVRPPMANPSSIMKLYLGQLSDGELAAYLDQHIAVESRGRLEEEIQKARVEGVAFNRGDTFSDLSAVAAAIISRGVLTACIAVGGPTARVGPRCEEMADALRTAGNDIADRLEPVFGVER